MKEIKMNVFLSTALFCALMIAISDSKAVGSLVESRRQTNTILSKTRNLHRNQRQLADSSIFRGISDFAYMGEIAIPNFRKNEYSRLKPEPTSTTTSATTTSATTTFPTTTSPTTTSTTTTSTTTTSTTERPRASGPSACQLMCHRRITNEYNPRCGSDGITYYNPGKLDCAKRCGKEISKFTYASCGPGSRVI